MEKKEKWIEEMKKDIRMKGKSCENCSKSILPLGFPMIFYEEESQEKRVVFKCSACKLKAVGLILNSKKVFWFYVTKNQKLIV